MYKRQTLSGLMKSNFVSEVQGKPTALYVLKNQNGAEACVTNWGGRLVSVMVPDKNGKMTDVVLGYDNIQQYVDNPNNNYGGLIGRYGNRIANGKFTLDGVEYQLPQNNNGHCLQDVYKRQVQGKPTALYVLKNQNGAEACVTNWGGRLVSVMVCLLYTSLYFHSST